MTIPSVILYSHPTAAANGMAVDLRYWMTKDTPEKESTIAEFYISSDSFYLPWLVVGSNIGLVINGKTRCGRITYLESCALQGNLSKTLSYKVHLEEEKMELW